MESKESTSSIMTKQNSNANKVDNDNANHKQEKKRNFAKEAEGKEKNAGFIYTYKDFSKASDEQAAQLSRYSHTGRLRQQNTFPIKLHSIIERAEIDNYSHIISWLPHGRSFQIHDNSMLLECILKKFFYISKFSSFQRQLNIYGKNVQRYCVL